MKTPPVIKRFDIKRDPNKFPIVHCIFNGERLNSKGILATYIESTKEGICVDGEIIIPTNLLRYQDKWYRPNCFTIEK